MHPTYWIWINSMAQELEEKKKVEIFKLCWSGFSKLCSFVRNCWSFKFKKGESKEGDEEEQKLSPEAQQN